MTSWFWLVGAVVTVVMQSLVKDVLGGNEEVITTCNAIFAISIAIGSGLAAWLAAGRIILLPTLIAGVLLGIFALDIGLSTMWAQPIAGLAGYWDIFKSGRGIRFVIDLAGIAISGGLFIVPVFSAVQAWAGPDRRARVIAGVNVINAGFMAGSAAIVAALQAAGLSTPGVFVLLGVCSLFVAVAIGRTMPASAFADALSIIYRALFRMEVHGIDNLNNAGKNLDYRAQPCELPRRRALARAHQPQAGVRHRHRHLEIVVGAAVREADQCDAARPPEADGGAHLDRRGQGRQRADHLPGRAHHRHRQPDEGL